MKGSKKSKEQQELTEFNFQRLHEMFDQFKQEVDIKDLLVNDEEVNKHYILFHIL